MGLWVAWSVYDFGRQRAGYDAAETDRRMAMVEVRLQQSIAENRMLREKISFLERGKEIDRQAYAEVERNLKGLQDELLELKQQLNFYQGIVSPEEVGNGVHVQSLRLVPTDEQAGYRFELVLIQGPTRAKRVKGTVDIAVTGLLNGVEDEFPLSEIANGEAPNLNYDFKYYQSFSGSFSLPQALQPTRVVVTVDPRGSREKSFERVYIWEELSALGGA